MRSGVVSLPRIAAMNLRRCCGFGLFGPNGATGCSHGWSTGRCTAGGAQPVEKFVFQCARPEGAEESPRREADQSNTYRSSNSTPCARSIRKSSDLKSSFL